MLRLDADEAIATQGATMLTESQLRRIMPNLALAKCQAYLPHLNQAMREHAVDSALRTAAFVAQLAHESGEFRYMEELWGPTAAQRRYEPASDLATRLGNRDPGDGRRYKGRGPIQITGRYNYQKYGALLGVDLVAGPELAATPAIAFATAGLFWISNGLNALADAQRFETITRRINGGVNGLAERQRYYARALEVLAEGYVADEAAPLPRGSRRSVDLEPLPRGSEAIFELLGEPKKAAVKKAAVKQAAVKNGAVRKAAVKKAAVKKGAVKKVAVEKAAMKKAAVKKIVKQKAVQKAALKSTARTGATPAARKSATARRAAKPGR